MQACTNAAGEMQCYTTPIEDKQILLVWLAFAMLGVARPLSHPALWVSHAQCTATLSLSICVSVAHPDTQRESVSESVWVCDTHTEEVAADHGHRFTQRACVHRKNPTHKHVSLL